jgi:hypothetical protein
MKIPRLTIPEVAQLLGLKYQAARDRVLQGTFGATEGNERKQRTVLRSKVMGYLRKYGPQSDADGG